MVEPVGTVLGALGVFGLLTVCLDCFDFMHIGNSLGKDFVLLEGQLSGLRIRLYAWSKACGLFNLDGYDPRIDHPNWKYHIKTQLNGIFLLFLDAAKLVKKYDLEERYEQPGNSPASPNPQFIGESLKDFLQRIKKTKKRSGLYGGFLWALKDKKAFTELLQRLRECIEALELVTKNLDLFESQRRVIEHEIASISDPGTLEGMITEELDEDIVSDLASQRLVEVRSLAETGSCTATFYTAPSHLEEVLRPRIIPMEQEQKPADSSMILYTAPSKLEEMVKAWAIENFSPDFLYRRDAAIFKIIAREKALAKEKEQQNQTPIKFREADLTWGNQLKTLRLADAEKLPRTREQLKNPNSLLEGSILKRLLKLGGKKGLPCTAALVADCLDRVRVSFEGPAASPYEKGIFHLLFQFPANFPLEPPIVRMLTRTYHPNIDPRGKICISTLAARSWSPHGSTLDHIAISICSMLDDPSLEDPLVPEIAACYAQDPDQYTRNARAYTEKYATLDQDISDERLLSEAMEF